MKNKIFNTDRLWGIWLLAVSFVLGGVFTWHFFPRTVTVTKTETVEVPVKVAVQEKRETAVSYVPKEIVSVKKSGGMVTAAPENTDVEIRNKPSAIQVKVNEKQYSFAPLPEEKHKFDKGKLLVEQSSNVDLNLKIPIQVVDKTKRNAIGYGYNSRHEEELTLRHRFCDRWGVYVRGEGDVFKHVTGHGKGLRSCGAGVEFYF